MPSYTHKKLVEQIRHIDTLPSNKPAYLQWIGAPEHLRLMRTNAASDEIIVHASGSYTFVTSLVIPNGHIKKAKKEDLLRWSCNPYTSIASYVSGGGRPGMRIERGGSGRGSKVLDTGKDLVFGRTFEGWSGEGRNYYEINQEYTHLAGIHWREEYQAHCLYDENGDIDYVVSVTSGDSSLDSVSLISFEWKKLEEYLAISDTSLVRMFDFTLLDCKSFQDWPNTSENLVVESDDFFYRQKLGKDCGYTRGVQIIRVRRPAKVLMAEAANPWGSPKARTYVEFIANDWRNGVVTKISTDPSLTTNYFQTDNSLPFELSPAFFRPEVLSKYKTDREKYTVNDRDIRCRSSWSLRGYDVNEAGQVHAYICDLRSLPHREQLHWLSYNEPPKTGISARAFTNDFKGEFTTIRQPREEVLSALRQWRESKVWWWRIRDERILERANPPLSDSKDEWAEACMDISKLVVEGLEQKAIQKKLDEAGIAYDTTKEQSLTLLEKILTHKNANNAPVSLTAIRHVQRIRSKVKGHSGSSEGTRMIKEAISQHGSLAAHFSHLCEQVAIELRAIDDLLT